jgi:GAF domain-containing protein
LDPEIVRLLEENYLRLEEKARHTIEEMTALDTDMSILRGTAPAAGFAQEEGGEAQGMRSALSIPPVANSGSPQAAIADQKARAIGALRNLLDAVENAQSNSAAISELLQSLVPFDCLAVYFKSRDMIAAEYMDDRCKQAFSAQPFPIGKGLSGWVAENARPIVNGNPTVEPNFLAETALFTATGSALSIPLMDSGNGVMGVLTLYARKPAAFSKDHLRIIEEIGPQIALTLVDHQKSEAVAIESGKAHRLEFRGAPS